MKNSGDNLFGTIPVRNTEAPMFRRFLDSQDFSARTIAAVISDIQKFARWFATANNEPFEVSRVTTRDIADFREFLRREKGQAVATVNRCLVSIRRYLGHLNKEGILTANPAKAIKQLRRQPLCPKGLEPPQVRKLMREVELRGDIRASAIFSLMLYTGARVGDVVNLELQDLMLFERSGTAVFRHGKGGKQRNVPLPLPARKALQAYLETRPPLNDLNVFVGERGSLTDRGVRALCWKYSALVGFGFSPHVLRHTFAHAFLRDSNNDLVACAQILGHENLSTTARYAQRTEDALAAAAENLTY